MINGDLEVSPDVSFSVQAPRAKLRGIGAQQRLVGRTLPWQGRPVDDRGATLILALLFLTVVSLVTVAVVNLAGANLNNTGKFRSAHAFESASNNANQVAVQYVRYGFISQTLNADPPVPCWTTSPTPSTVSSQGQTVDAWCSTRWTPSAQTTRVVTISTCLSSVSAATCAANPLLQTVVSIGDIIPSSGINECVPSASPIDVALTGCGTKLVLNSWVFTPQPPTVSNVASAGTATCTSPSRSVEITGTGFNNVSSVYFVLVGGAPSNRVFPVTAALTVKSSGTIIDTCTPASGSGAGPTHVVVVTPSGSAFGSTNYSF